MVSWKELLAEELQTIKSRHKLKSYHAFIYWYVKATENLEDRAIHDCLMDGANDGSSDVVLVDHNPEFLTALIELLGHFTGVNVVGSASSGKEGIDCAGELDADLVFVDLNMPDMSGFDVAEKLHALHPWMRVVIISLHDEMEYRQRAAEVCAEAFICKYNLFLALPEIVSRRCRRVHQSQKSQAVLCDVF